MRIDEDTNEFLSSRIMIDGEELELSNQKVFCLHEDNQRNIWVGTFGSGLNKITLDENGSARKVEYFRKNNVLPDDAIYGILPEGDDFMWISTDMGLIKYNIESNTIDLFDVRDGLPQNNFRQGAFFKGASGYYYFGGIDSLNLINHFIQPNTSYELRVNMSSAQSNNGFITSIGGVTAVNPNGNSSDLIDSDGLLSSNGLFAFVNFSTGDINENDYSFDFGFNDCQNYNEEIVHQGCEGDGFNITVNGTLYDENNPSGVENMLTAAGCDSIITIDLSFGPNYSEDIDYVGCSGDGYGIIVNGVVYNESNPIGMENIITSSGCDSIINVNLIFNNAVTVEAGMLPKNYLQLENI